MVRMFDRVGLQTNLGKTKAMICMPGFIWGQHGVEVYNRRDTGEGPDFQEGKSTRVSCDDCGGTMYAYSLRHHMEISHGRVFTKVRGVDVGGGLLDIYKL